MGLFHRKSLGELEEELHRKEELATYLKTIKKKPVSMSMMGGKEGYSGIYGDFLREFDSAGDSEERKRILEKEIRRFMARGNTKKVAINKIRAILERHNEDIEFDLEEEEK